MTYVYIALSAVAVLGGLSLLSYILNGPKPKFKPARLAKIIRDHVYKGHHLLIEDRKWRKESSNSSCRTWMYGGCVVTGNPGGGILVLSRYMTIPEESLGYVPGLEN